jgi:plastocyanin
MNKKTYLWLVLVLIVGAAVIYLLVSSNNVSPVKTGDQAAIENGAKNSQIASSSDGTTLPAGLTPIPNPASDASFSPETVIKVDGDSFTPKTIEAKAKTKVFLTFSATDDKRHTFSFTDPSLDFILVVFNKAEGNKSITFPAPKAGSYSFYIDNKTNTGTLVIK